MTTDEAPDFAGIAKRLSEREYPAPPYEPMPEGLDEVFAPDVRYTKQFAYASCMEARLRSDWETIRLLRASDHIASCAIYDPVPLFPKDCDCGLSAHLSKLLEPFTP
jgi:hypothetical protein